jgi:hypothetical protein
MATTPKVRSKEMEMTLLGSHRIMSSKKSPVEYVISNIQSSVITNPIDPARISKVPANGLTKSSVVKAGLVFLGTVGAYYLAKTTGIFSYFGWEVKNSNPKDVGSSEIMEVKNRANALISRTNLETARQVVNNPSVNRIAQTYKGEDRAVEFEEIKVEEFKDLPEIEKENLGMQKSFSRRSINIQNPIPNQNATVGKLFEVIIDGNNVFSFSSDFFLKATTIPTWLTSSNPNPTFKGSYDTPELALEVALSGNYAYVADYRSGLQIIDISDPSNSTFKGSYDTPNKARGVALSENYAYVADYRSGLQIIDISDPSNPTFKGSYDTPNYALGVAISSIYAYVTGNGLHIIDVSNPSNPTFKGSYPGGGLGVALSGNYAYGADGSGLQIIDISDPSNPTFKGSYDTPDQAYGVALSGNYAYVADWNSGLQIIDISDPSNPTFKGSYDTLYAFGVAISGNYAYVAGGDDYSSGFLQIIDINNPSNPTFKGSYDTPDQARGVAISENYAYVASMRAGLQIIAPNFDKLRLSGTPNSLGTYSVDIEACNEAKECVTDSFDIIVGNNAPVVANPIQDQTTIINTLFNYIFPNNTFMDPDGDSLTYTAKSSNNEPLPSWLNFNSYQSKFSGTPNTLTTYPIKITADDNFGGSVSTMFNLIVKDSSDTEVDITLIIISSMTVGVCIACIASFCLPLTIFGGIVMLRRHRNKILGNENNTKAKEQMQEKELQKLDTSNDKKIVVDRELPRPMEEQKNLDKVNEDVELEAIPYFRED